MKKLLMIAAVALMLCGNVWAEPNEPEAVTFWMSGSNLAYQNTNISAWLGIRKANIEFGAAAEWRMFSEGDTDSDIQSTFALGPYGAYHFPDLIDIPNPIDVEWLPDTLAGEPFVFLSYLIDLDGKGATIAPGVGIRLLDLFALSWEYSFYKGIPADDEGRIGLSVKYEF